MIINIINNINSNNNKISFFKQIIFIFIKLRELLKFNKIKEIYCKKEKNKTIKSSMCLTYFT